MTNSRTNFFEDLQKLTDLKKELKTKTEEALKLAIKKLLDFNPLLKSFTWYQYAPYFNDGEPCYFHLRNYGFVIDKSQTEALDAFKNLLDAKFEYYLDNCTDEDGDLFINEYEGWPSFRAGLLPSEIPSFIEDVKILWNLMRQHEDILELTFGTDAKIIVTRNGILIEDFTHHD